MPRAWDLGDVTEVERLGLVREGLALLLSCDDWWRAQVRPHSSQML
jgi:hypothetical protein